MNCSQRYDPIDQYRYFLNCRGLCFPRSGYRQTEDERSDITLEKGATKRFYKIILIVRALWLAINHFTWAYVCMCSPNLPRVYIRLCKHGNHFTFLHYNTNLKRCKPRGKQLSTIWKVLINISIQLLIVAPYTLAIFTLPFFNFFLCIRLWSNLVYVDHKVLYDYIPTVLQNSLGWIRLWM